MTNNFINKSEPAIQEDVITLRLEIAKLEDELLQEKIRNSDLKERLKKAKEMLSSWQSMQI